MANLINGTVPFEYFREAPSLAGKLAAAYIQSLQAQGVAACVKHFTANNQEDHRMSGCIELLREKAKQIVV